MKAPVFQDDQLALFGAADVSRQPKKRADKLERAIKADSPRPTQFDLTTDRLLRLPEVLHLTGLSRSSLYRLVKCQDFPASVDLSSNSVAWLLSEVSFWAAHRVAARDLPNRALGL